MALNQLNEEWNDAVQTYYPRLGKVRQSLHNLLTSITLRMLRLRRSAFSGIRLTNERIIEYPQILQWIRPQGRVLDVGCVSSRLPIQLASLGYEVYGIDLSLYAPVAHPNFHFYKEDLFQWKPPVQFDVVILLSTLEHMGHGAYGDAKIASGDARTVRLISEWLAPHGQVLVSVPFGKAGAIAKHRVYDSAGLAELFPGGSFRWVNERYFRRHDGAWSPVPKEELANVTSPDLPANGVAILNLEKR